MNTIKITRSIEAEVELSLPHFSKSADGCCWVCITGKDSKNGIQGIRIWICEHEVTVRNFSVDAQEVESNKHEFAAAYGVAMAKLNLNFDAIDKEVQP